MVKVTMETENAMLEATHGCVVKQHQTYSQKPDLVFFVSPAT